MQAASDSGGEGLIAELVRVEREGGRISGQEMVAMVFLLLGAGSETTTHLFSGSVYELTKAPPSHDWLKECLAAARRLRQRENQDAGRRDREAPAAASGR